jgi:hypothetical protein
MLAFGHVRQCVAHPMHDPNAIDRLCFTTAVAFCWAAVVKPRRLNRAGFPGGSDP